MDYNPRETARSLIKSQGKIPSIVWDDVLSAIDILHEKNLAFGDLRVRNLVCVTTESGGTMRAKHFDSN